jgi:hypothetical protein
MEFIDPKKLTQEDVENMWLKAKEVESAFDDRIKERADLFVKSLFENSLYIKLGEKGLIKISSIFIGAEASVHIIVWDKSEPHVLISMMQEALPFIFKKLQLERLTTFSAIFNEDVLRLAQLLGFQKEGQLRHSCVYKGEFYDTVLLGILKDEVLTKEV